MLAWRCCACKASATCTIGRDTLPADTSLGCEYLQSDAAAVVPMMAVAGLMMGFYAVVFVFVFLKRQARL